MSTDLVCDACGSANRIQDDLDQTRRTVRCTFCNAVLVDGKAESAADRHTARGEHPPADPFERDLYLIHQKRFSINERYYILDEDKDPLLLAERPTYPLRQIGTLAGAVGTFLLVGFVALLVTIYLENADIRIVAGVVGVLGLIATIGATIAAAIFLQPKRHVTFYRGESLEALQEPLLRIEQDRKFYALKATYSVRTPEGERLATLLKHYLYDFFRKQWRVLAPDGTMIALVQEDSILNSLMRRLLGPAFGALRTNFIILEPETPGGIRRVQSEVHVV